MEFVVNNSHKKMIINKELNPVKVNCNINDKLLKIELYSGCNYLNSIDNFPIVSKDLYEINYDVNSDLYSLDNLETNNISCLFSGMYKASLEEVKRR